MGAGFSKPGKEVALWHFDLLRVVGKGAFGKVRIVQKKDTKKLYALKYIDKMQCIHMHAIQNIFRERAILQHISHSYIVNLEFAFQDDQNMFFVLDLKTGGDLRYHLGMRMGFEEDVVKVWAAELASAIQYLHNNQIVHRDIKPDNVLLDESGHAHLSDFNIAVNIGHEEVLHSRSGTLAYLAPEVLRENGYSWQVDWWSLGVMLYELIYYKRPFRGNTTANLINSIKESPLTFPSTNMFIKLESMQSTTEITAECIQFLSELLDRNPITRLGCRTRQFVDIKQHDWMKAVGWKAVERKEVVSKFIPNSREDNFDPRINLEEYLLEGFPMEAAPRQRKRNKKAGTGAGTNASQHRRRSRSRGSSNGSLRRLFSSGTSAEKTSDAATNAAIVAGDTHAMLQHYESVPLFGGKRHQQPAVANRVGGEKPFSESERTEIELKFMADNFLPFDRMKTFATKKAIGLKLEVPPPVPDLPLDFKKYIQQQQTPTSAPLTATADDLTFAASASEINDTVNSSSTSSPTSTLEKPSPAAMSKSDTMAEPPSIFAHDTIRSGESLERVSISDSSPPTQSPQHLSIIHPSPQSYDMLDYDVRVFTEARINTTARKLRMNTASSNSSEFCNHINTAISRYGATSEIESTISMFPDSYSPASPLAVRAKRDALTDGNTLPRISSES